VVQAWQKNWRFSRPPSDENIASIEETNLSSIAFISSPCSPPRHRGFSTARVDRPVAEKPHQGQAKEVQNDVNLGMLAFETQYENLSGFMDSLQGNVFWDPDVPMQSIEEDSRELGLNHRSGIYNPKNMNPTMNTAHRVLNCLSRGASCTLAGVVDVPANETSRNFRPPQDSPQPSQNPLHTLTLAPTVTRLHEQLQKSLLDRHAHYLSTHQIPSKLRQCLDALTRRLHVDGEFRYCLIRYIMEATGKQHLALLYHLRYY
jgi:hypothetical protein